MKRKRNTITNRWNYLKESDVRGTFITPFYYKES